jgi:hypothetical protein
MNEGVSAKFSSVLLLNMRNRITSFLRITIVPVLLLGGASQVWSDDLSEARLRAKNGDHAEAVRLFERHLQTARPSASLYYELGGAAKNSSKPALAALNFRRALVLNPRFDASQKALAETNLSLGVASDLADWKVGVASKVPLNPILMTGIVLFWLGLFIFILGFHVRSQRFFDVGLILIGVLLIVLAWVCDPRVNLIRQRFVMATQGCEVFNAPVDNSEKLTKLPQGSVITAISERGRWIYGQLPGGAKGWFLSEGLESVIPGK